MNKILQSVLEETPPQYYETLIHLSAGENGEQDFAMFGESELMTDHFAAMIYRHEMFRQMVIDALQKASCLFQQEQQQNQQN